MKKIKYFFENYQSILIMFLFLLFWFWWVYYMFFDKYKIKQYVYFDIENNDTIYKISTNVNFSYHEVMEWYDKTKNIDSVKIIAEKRKIDADSFIEYDKKNRDMKKDLQDKLDKKICN